MRAELIARIGPRVGAGGGRDRARILLALAIATEALQMQLDGIRRGSGTYGGERGHEAGIEDAVAGGVPS